MESGLKRYWLERGLARVVYRNEVFYTITPVSHYRQRRKKLLSLMKPEFSSLNSERPVVVDFGCGDGYYLKCFASVFPSVQWYAVDISQTMLQRARNALPTARFFTQLTEITEKADLIYCIAVLAHILDDSILGNVLDEMSQKVNPGGRVILFEQTAPCFQGDSRYRRRPFSFYIKEMERRGLSLESNRLFYYGAHVFFERRIAKLWYRFIAKGVTDYDRRLHANQSPLFRLLSRFFTFISICPVRSPCEDKWGYTYLVFVKREAR